MEKQVKAHMLPTEDKSHLILFQGKLNYGTNAIWNDDRVGYLTQHVYITVSQDVEPIKEGDWYYNSLDNHVKQSQQENMLSFKGSRVKIIATSDPKLTVETELNAYYRNGIGEAKKIPQLPQSFLKEYAANPDGEWEVEYHFEGEFCGLCGFTRESKQCINRSECDNKWSGGELKPKLDSDNCVILTENESAQAAEFYRDRTKEMMYSTKECKHPFKRLHWVGTKVYCNKCNTTLVKPVEEKMYTFLELRETCVYFAYTTYPWTTQEVDDWIKENL